MLVLLDLCRGLTGSSPDLSSRAGDTGRIEDVLVHRSSGRYAFNSALVVSQVMRVEQSGRTACEPRVAGGVGLGKVESGGTPARHTLSEHEHKHKPVDRHLTERHRDEKGCGGAETHCHWHLSQVVGVAAMAWSVAGVSLVAMARREVSSLERRESIVSRWR